MNKHELSFVDGAFIYHYGSDMVVVMKHIVTIKTPNQAILQIRSHGEIVKEHCHDILKGIPHESTNMYKSLMRHFKNTGKCLKRKYFEITYGEGNALHKFKRMDEENEPPEVIHRLRNK